MRGVGVSPGVLGMGNVVSGPKAVKMFKVCGRPKVSRVSSGVGGFSHAYRFPGKSVERFIGYAMSCWDHMFYAKLYDTRRSVIDQTFYAGRTKLDKRPYPLFSW